MKKSKKELDENKVRVIKISKEALFEFIYENFIDDEKLFLDVDPGTACSSFAINFERGEFIVCTYKLENDEGKLLSLPKEVDLQKLMLNIPDTTPSMYIDGRYKEYTKEELVKLSGG